MSAVVYLVKALLRLQQAVKYWNERFNVVGDVFIFVGNPNMTPGTISWL